MFYYIFPRAASLNKNYFQNYANAIKVVSLSTTIHKVKIQPPSFSSVPPLSPSSKPLSCIAQNLAYNARLSTTTTQCNSYGMQCYVVYRMELHISTPGGRKWSLYTRVFCSRLLLLLLLNWPLGVTPERGKKWLQDTCDISKLWEWTIHAWAWLGREMQSGLL